jgi:predicted metal-dependent phosphotriesterase family hydrolase
MAARLCYVLRHLLLRLKRHGVSDAAISVMLIDNPRKVFLADSRLGDVAR